MTTLREAAQQALEVEADRRRKALAAEMRAALAQQAEPVQEPWSTRERFYEAIGRAVEAVRQEMKIKTATMRLPEYDITLPIIDARSGHVLVGPVVPAPPQRKPLTDEDAAALIELDPRMLTEFGTAPSGAAMELIRRTERAHGIGGQE